jgi:glycosyltransferase involved in cell wall biosynthesis
VITRFRWVAAGIQFDDLPNHRCEHDAGEPNGHGNYSRSKARICLGSYPLVAVVTPVFNGEAYLSETMESVQALEYPNILHVILDNGSTDSTPAIIERYRNLCVPLLTARRSATVAMATNWNAALAMAPPEARYVRLLCADDMMRPDAIMKYVDIAERYPDVGVVGCLWRAHALCGEELPADQEVFNGEEILGSYLRRQHTALSGMHVLIRRTEIETRQPFYDETLASFDSEANMRICMRSRFGFVRAELSTWRQHAGNTTNTTAVKAFAHEMCWLRLLDRYGPTILGFQGYIECRRRYRQQLLRRLLKARARDENTRVFDNCLERLRLAGDPVSLGDLVQALLDWGFLAITRQRHRVGMPRRHIMPRPGAASAAHVPEF